MESLGLGLVVSAQLPWNSISLSIAHTLTAQVEKFRIHSSDLWSLCLITSSREEPQRLQYEHSSVGLQRFLDIFSQNQLNMARINLLEGK